MNFHSLKRAIIVNNFLKRSLMRIQYSVFVWHCFEKKKIMNLKKEIKKKNKKKEKHKFKKWYTMNWKSSQFILNQFSTNNLVRYIKHFV